VEGRHSKWVKEKGKGLDKKTPGGTKKVARGEEWGGYKKKTKIVGGKEGSAGEEKGKRRSGWTNLGRGQPVRKRAGVSHGCRTLGGLRAKERTKRGQVEKHWGEKNPRGAGKQTWGKKLSKGKEIIKGGGWVTL